MLHLPVLLDCSLSGTLKYTYMYPGYGKYTKMYPGNLTLNQSLSTFFVIIIYTHLCQFSVEWPLYYRNTYSKSMLMQCFLKKSVFKIICCAFYDIGFWARLQLGYSLISTEYNYVYLPYLGYM